MGPQTMSPLGEPEPRSNQSGVSASRAIIFCAVRIVPLFFFLWVWFYGSIAVESLLLCLNFISLLFSVSLPNEPKLAV
jgi:hypothetical protein